MKIMTIVLTMTALMLGAVGCTSQQHADNLQKAYRKSQEQVVELQGRISELEQQVALLQGQVESNSVEYQSLIAQRDQLKLQLVELQGDMTRLRGDNTNLKSEIALLKSQTPIQVLPKELEDKLQKFADQYPGLASYDKTTGSVKFASDLTFARGSDVLSSAARESLKKLATIFNSPEAARYEVRVVGHTDAMRIARPATRAKHPTNWHLSVHRAIAVRNALNTAGVDDVRTSVSGYSKYRPMVKNSSRGAASENRRVEINLVPMAAVDETLLPASTPGNTDTPAIDTTITPRPTAPGDAIYK